MKSCTLASIPEFTDQKLEPRQALRDYFETYVERDVRRIGEIRNLSSFRRFVRLCAGRVGQLLNLSSLGTDAGVSHTTAKSWLTLLEASYIVFQLEPFHANIRKRLTKSPKLYFYDVGLASHLIGIEHAGQISSHPLRGALFENAVVAEAVKHRFNRGQPSNFFFFRDSQGLECDLLCQNGNDLAAIEIKSGATVASDYFDPINRVARILPQVTSKTLVYGGSQRQVRHNIPAVPMTDMSAALEAIEREETLRIQDHEPVRWMVSFWHSEGRSRDEPDFPEVSFWHPDEETAKTEASRVLIELVEQRGDNRDWTAAGHPDPFAVGSGKHPGGQWILRYRDLLRDTDSRSDS